MLDLRPEHHALVREILATYAPSVKAWAFGSRVNGTARKFSDLDIALDAGGELDLRTMAELRNAFQESDLPISVDLLDLRTTRPLFRKLIEKEQVAL
ncbi:MAG: nucleotidyltransferase domain-containing protein [Flavobacteriales bacterium]|nr:nucleotidyltransferase domain-containing protein [Flavobacteriales bacterium]